MRKIVRELVVMLCVICISLPAGVMANPLASMQTEQRIEGVTLPKLKSKKKKIRLNKKKMTLKVGQKKKLKLENAKAKKVKWSSSNKKVARVTKAGKVKALRKGKATIFAKYKKRKYKCRLTVKKATDTLPKSIDGSTLLQSVFLLDNLYKNENIIVSPTSLNLVLGMAANGATDETKAALEKYLGKSANEYNQYASSLMEKAEGDEMLTLANGVWYKDGCRIKPDFSSQITRYYSAELKEAPFDQSTVEQINQWASDHTKKMIPKVLDEIPRDAVTILANALLFEGKWTNAFQAEDTYKRTFTKIDGVKEDVDMMSATENIYYENDYAVGFEKTYGNDARYSFIAILPKKKGEFKLSNLNLPKFLKTKTTKYPVQIVMPKFSYSWDDELTNTLKNTNVKIIFDESKNPLGNLVESPYPVYASDVFQACKITVDEEGTKAAAVTTMIVKNASAIVQSNRKEVVLDRPFGYIIMDNRTNEVLFMGKVIEPGEK